MRWKKLAQAKVNNKVNIYPIDVNIEAGGSPYKARAYKLNTTGMMLEVFVNTFTPQQQIKIKWLLPIDNISIEEDAVVVKKYSQQRGDKIQYIMEIHFKKLKFQHQKAITSLIDRVSASEKKAVK